MLSPVAVGETTARPVIPVSSPDRVSALLEEVARIEGWPAADYLELRDELARETAAKGRGAQLTREELHSRHDAIIRKRLQLSQSDLFNQ